MKLKTRLFLSMGGIFLLVSALSYFLPDYLIRKQVDTSAEKIDTAIQDEEERFYALISKIMDERFNEIKDGLSTFLEMVSTLKLVQDDNFYLAAAKLLPFSSDLGFIQVTDEQGITRALVPAHYQEHAYLVFAEGDQLYVQIDEKEKRAYRALSVQGEQYLLYPVDSTRGEQVKIHEKEGSTWLMGVSLIEKFMPYYVKEEKNTPAGYFEYDAKTQNSALLIAEDVITPLSLEVGKRLAVEKTTGLIFQVQEVANDNVKGMAGFVVSDLVEKIANTVKRCVILVVDRVGNSGFTAEGLAFNPEKEGIDVSKLNTEGGQILWRGKDYAYQTFPLGSEWESAFIVLQPADQVISISAIMGSLRLELLHQLSVNLLGATLIGLVIALLLLAKIAAKVTKPISALAVAAENVGKGDYDKVQLPDVGKREDEVEVLTLEFEKMIGALKEREKIRGVLNKVVSKEVAEQILKKSIELGGEERVVSILFSDIRGFTKQTEKANPQHVIKHVNIYLTEMCRIIDEQGGVVDKFVGDEIMALYGAPLDLDEHAQKSVATAILMIGALRELNETRKAIRLPPIEIGIGIHTGLVVAGNVGSENRLSYTVLGANVNLASRLCSIAKPMQILVSEATIEAIKECNRFRYQEIEPQMLKGFSKPIRLFEIIGFLQ